MLGSELRQRIESMIHAAPVVLFMKGEKEAPMCGFSAQVVHILRQYGVPFEAHNVLENWDLREGIKAYSNWPTIPQLYVNQAFVGGCDIVMELHRKGELAEVVGGQQQA